MSLALNLAFAVVAITACFVAGAFVYLLPAIIAYRRQHSQKRAIFALNLLLGWSFLGWAVAMIWAWTNQGKGADTDAADLVPT